MEKGLTVIHIFDECFVTGMFWTRCWNPTHGDVGSFYPRDFANRGQFLLSSYPVTEYLKIGVQPIPQDMQDLACVECLRATNCRESYMTPELSHVKKFTFRGVTCIFTRREKLSLKCLHFGANSLKSRSQVFISVKGDRTPYKNENVAKSIRSFSHLFLNLFV